MVFKILVLGFFEVPLPPPQVAPVFEDSRSKWHEKDLVKISLTRSNWHFSLSYEDFQ